MKNQQKQDVYESMRQQRYFNVEDSPAESFIDPIKLSIVPKYLKDQRKRIHGLASPHSLLANLQNRPPENPKSTKSIMVSDDDSDDVAPGKVNQKKPNTKG